MKVETTETRRHGEGEEQERLSGCSVESCKWMCSLSDHEIAMMMMNYDHYAVAHRLANSLECEGHGEWASKIRTTIGEGSTGTEIFMGFQWQLRQLKSSGVVLPQGIFDQIDELLGELEKALA